MPARDPAGAAVLERRDRRLLRCYPSSHREFHREEMLGVLLAAARPGQRAPGLRQAVNLAACGLVIRVRRIPGWLAADAGQDALAVVSLIAPAVVVILLALGWGAQAAAFAAAARVPFGPGASGCASPWEWVVAMIAWLAVVLLGLTGSRGAAAAIASISLTLAWPVVLTAGVQQSVSLSGGLVLFLGPARNVPVFLASLAACSLVFSPGPLRGLAIVGWRRASFMIAGLSAGFGYFLIVQLADPAAPLGDIAFRLLGILVIALALAVTRIRGPVGRRVAGLVAAGLLPSLAVTFPCSRTPAGGTWCPCSSSCSPPCWCGRWQSCPGWGGSAGHRARGDGRDGDADNREGMAMSWSSHRGASAATGGRCR